MLRNSDLKRKEIEMDDMKRSIYMLALEKINNGKSGLVCGALRKAIVEIAGYDPLMLSNNDLVEFFPEFFSLWDRKYWYKYGNSIRFYIVTGGITGSNWWKYGWKEPRVRILNCILCQH